MHFSANVAANTQAYAVIISDRLINFQSDGNKFSVVILIFFFFSYIKIMNVKELKTLLKKNKIHFYTYSGKKKLTTLANDHHLLPKSEPKKEKSKDRLKKNQEEPEESYVRGH